MQNPQRAFLFTALIAAGMGAAFIGGYGLKNSRSFTASILPLDIGTTTASSSAVQPPAPPPYKITDYQMQVNLDDCALAKFSAQGWQVSQLGEVVLGNPGYDSDCSTRKNMTIDWLLLSRERPQVQNNN